MSESSPQSSGSDSSWVGIVAYLTIIGFIVALILKSTSDDNNTEFNRFHVRQMLGLILTGIALQLLNIVPVLGTIVSLIGSLVLLVFWIIGLIGAIQKKTDPLPLVGEYYQNWFASL